MGTDGGGICKYDGKNFEIINKSNGLTGNIIRSLFEDSHGNIWIGTDNGITIYDGLNYQRITEENNYQGSFALKIYETTDHKILIATNDAGLYEIDINDSLKLTNYTIYDGLANNFIFDIYEDLHGKIWLAMIGGINILQFDDSTLNVTKLIEGRDIPSGFVTCIEANQSDELLFGTINNGAFKITNPESLSNYNVAGILQDILPHQTTIWDIYCQSNDDTWYASENSGVLRLNNNEVQFYNKDNALETNQVLNIIQDLEGNIWLTTMEAGAYLYIGNELITYQTKDGLPDNNISSLYYDKGSLYTGTKEGLAQFKTSGEQLELKNQFNVNNGLTDNNINAIIKDENQNIWVGTHKGINIIKPNKIKILQKKDGLNSNKILCLFIDNENVMWVGTDNGYNKIIDQNIYSFTQSEGFINSEVQTITQDKHGRIWMGTLGGLVKLDKEIYTDYNEEEGLYDLRIHCLAEDRDGNLWIGTFGGGVYKFDHTKDSLPINLIANNDILSSNNIYSLAFLNDTSLIVGTDKGFDYLLLNQSLQIKKVLHYDTNDGFIGGENNLNAITNDLKGNIWFGTIDGLTRYNPTKALDEIKKPKAYITNLKLFFENVDWESRGVTQDKWFNTPGKLELSHNENHITFNISGIYFKDPYDLEYSYFLEGQSKTWSPYSKNQEIVYQGLTPGNYAFKVKAKNKYDQVSPVDSIQFSIKPPFYKTWWFISILIVIFIILIITYIRYRESKLKRDKIKLEKTVEERTKEVVQQKDIVTAQKQEITDSIQYAQNIQNAVLPKEKIFQEAFSDYFILFRPKDIVSGDFYWITQKDQFTVFTAADCTGHGVPGAFMSMLGVSYLNKIVNEHNITQTNIILNTLRENIIDSLQQKGVSQENKDGMDISICSLDTKNKKIQFSGANNSMLLIKNQNNEFVLNEVKADRMPVAIYSIMNDFSAHDFEIEKGDTIYLYSDGYIDQFGGPQGKKFMKKNFKKLILEIQNYGMEKQKNILAQKLDEWMTNNNNGQPFEQIDDIIVLGVKF